MFDLTTFSTLRGIAAVPAIRFDAVVELTGLDWREATETGEIPKTPGVYAWVDHAGLVIYHGSGMGSHGLRGRLGREMGWGENQRRRIREYDSTDPDDGAWILGESPVIRMIAEQRPQLWVAQAAPASWTIPDHPGLAMPATAVGWEIFIYACSLYVAGRRSLLGGGAWEAKKGSLGADMEWTAWYRLRQVMGM